MAVLIDECSGNADAILSGRAGFGVSAGPDTLGVAYGDLTFGTI